MNYKQSETEKRKAKAEPGSDQWVRQGAPSTSGSLDERQRSSSRGKESRSHRELSFRHWKREKKEAKAAAWLESQTAKIDKRYEKKNSEIQLWEDKEKSKATVKYKEIEGRRAVEKMHSGMDKVHKRAERKREKMNAKKEAEIAAAVEKADKIRRKGKAPTPFCC